MNGTGIATIESIDGQSKRKTQCDGVLGSVHTGKKESSKFTVKLTDKACYEFEARVRTEGFQHFCKMSIILTLTQNSSKERDLSLMEISKPSFARQVVSKQSHAAKE